MSDLFKLGLEIATGAGVPSMPSAPGAAASSATAASSPSSTPQTLGQLTKELLSTERTYIKRMRALKETYADPLRSNSLDKTRSVTILSPQDSLVLFGNIDELVVLNEAFISDLWTVSSGLSEKSETVGDVVLRHFSTPKLQKEYKTYFDGFGALQDKYEELLKSRKQLAPFLKVADGKIEDLPGVGLKDLLKDPVVRLARYTLLWKAMIATLSSDADASQRKQLEEATEIVWTIAADDPRRERPH